MIRHIETRVQLIVNVPKYERISNYVVKQAKPLVKRIERLYPVNKVYVSCNDSTSVKIVIVVKPNSSIALLEFYLNELVKMFDEGILTNP